jgi:hypothetical protein
VTAAQLPLSPRCSRCGRPVEALEEVRERTARAYVAIRDRRLAVPSAAMDDLRAASEALACLAGSCAPRAA